MKKQRCYNCKHASKGFKLGKLTHHTCLHPKMLKLISEGELHPLDALNVYSDSCKRHEFKNKEQ